MLLKGHSRYACLCGGNFFEKIIKNPLKIQNRGAKTGKMTIKISFFVGFVTRCVIKQLKILCFDEKNSIAISPII